MWRSRPPVSLKRSAQAQAARAALTPNLGAGLDTARSQTVGPLGTPLLQTEVAPQLQVRYEVDLFGRLRRLRAAARDELLASREARDLAAIGIAATTATTYITLRALDARLATARQTLADRTQALHFARRRAETGYTSQLEFVQAEAEYRATAQVIPQTELAIARTENALTLLTEAPPGPVARGRALHQIALPAIPAVLPSDLLRRRPDIAAAESQLAATDARLAAARLAFLPRFNLAASGGVAFSTALACLIGLFSLGGSVLAPLFDGGRLRAAENSGAAARDQAALSYRSTALTAFREVNDNLAAVNWLAAQEAEISLQRAALARALFHASERYRAGYASYLEQLDAERQLLAADLTLIQARADRLSALIALYRAMGGGWIGSGGGPVPASKG